MPDDEPAGPKIPSNRLSQTVSVPLPRPSPETNPSARYRTSEAGDNSHAFSGPFVFTLDPGQSAPINVEFGNTGTTAWTGSQGYSLHNTTLGNTFTLSQGHTPQGGAQGCDGLEPGGTCIWNISFNLNTGDPASGTFSYRISHSGVDFGDTITVTWGPSGNPPLNQAIDNSHALSGPFNFVLNQGQQQSYVLDFSNTGTTTWLTSQGYAVHNTTNDKVFSLNNCNNTGPQGECKYEITLTVGSGDALSGTYRYQMSHSGKDFGDTITVTWGPNSNPVPSSRRAGFDFDGDGKSDLAVYYPGGPPGSQSTWFITPSSGGPVLG